MKKIKGQLNEESRDFGIFSKELGAGRGDTMPVQRNIENAAAQAEFSGKKWVWVKDLKKAFIKGWIVKEEADYVCVRCIDDTVCFFPVLFRKLRSLGPCCQNM